MPIRRVEYVDQPYAGRRHTPDTTRLTALYTRMGEALADAALRRGEITQRGLQSLGQLFSGYRQTKREESALATAEARRERERKEDRDYAAEQQRLEREARQAERDEAERIRAEERAYRRGADVAAEVGFGPMSEQQLEDVMAGPAAGRVRYEFGPGTAEGPTLDPTREQRDMDTIRQQIERFGGMVGPNGQIVMPPKPEREPNPTEATLALRAAQGDTAASQALRLMQQGSGTAARVWVLRNGTPLRVAEAEIQPGDEPYRAPTDVRSSALDRQRIARVDAAKGFLERLNTLREKINTKIGPAAGATGLMRRGVANIGWDPDVAEYERIKAAGGRALAIAIMGAQNLSDADAKSWSDMLPGATVDAVTAKRLTDQIGTMLDDMGARDAAESGRVSAVPDLSGLQPGHGRTFESGPFAGQTWTVDAQGKPRKVGG